MEAARAARSHRGGGSESGRLDGRHGAGELTRSGFLLDVREWREPVQRVSVPGKRHSSHDASQYSLPKGIEPCLGVPPIDSGFPAFAPRSDRKWPHGKSGRSCSPSLTYVISCRDSALWQSRGQPRQGCRQLPFQARGTTACRTLLRTSDICGEVAARVCPTLRYRPPF